MPSFMEMFAPQTLAGIRSRDEELERRKLSEFFQRPERFEGVAGQAPSAEVMMAYQNLHGSPWPSQNTEGQQIPTAQELPTNLPMEIPAQARSVEDMLVRQAGQAGRAAGTRAGETAMTTGSYGDDIMRQQIGNIESVASDYGEDIGTEAGSVDPFGSVVPRVGAADQQRLIQTPAGMVSEQYAHHYLDGGGGAGGEKMPENVKQAIDFVQSLAKSRGVDPATALIMAINPQAAQDPQMKAALEGGMDPQTKAVYEMMLGVIKQHYGQQDPLQLR